ncbi:solute carrier family 22 member 20-like [Dermacentor albipictus]|uniref:solute carrier family 22 member 20-like n=1 Tax=Dermacentor albipictus TaxID=60249 RepID=UPI0038FC6FEF
MTKSATGYARDQPMNSISTQATIIDQCGSGIISVRSGRGNVKAVQDHHHHHQSQKKKIPSNAVPVSKKGRPSVSTPPASATKKTVVLSDRYEEKPLFGTGAFQFQVIMTLSLAAGTFALHSNIFKLTATVMDHWCRRPALFENLSVAEWKELAIPVDERGKHSRCTVRDPPGAGSAARIVRCTSWEFDLSAHGHKIVSQWSLVCDRRWLIAVAWLVHSVACMAPLALAGALGDYIGRRIVVLIALPAMLIAGVASSIPNDFHSFVAVRSIVSAAISALVPPLVALVYEVTPMGKMPVYSVASAALLVVASPVALFVTRFFKAGWAAVQLVLMAPACLLLAIYYTVDESPARLLEASVLGDRACHTSMSQTACCDFITEHAK